MSRIISRWFCLACGCGLVLLPTILFALDPTRSLFQYNCQNWNRQNGMPVGGVNAVTQTKDGYLWLGTGNGLVRFDGDEFVLVPVPKGPQFSGAAISCLAAAKAGGLWFGVAGGAFGHYDSGGFRASHSESWANSGLTILGVCEARDGALWLGGGFGAARVIEGDTNQTVELTEVSDCLSVFEDSHGRIWLGTTSKGVLLWQGGKLTHFPDESLNSCRVFAIAEDIQGQIWIGTDKGLRAYDMRFQPLAIPNLETEVRCLLADRQGMVWIGTRERGLARFQNNGYAFFAKADGLADDFVLCLFEDQEGSIWAGTRSGLSQLSDLKFPNYSAGEGVLGGTCHSVAPSRNGGLWIATDRGVSWFDGQNAENYTTNSGLAFPYIKRVLETCNGDVYLINGRRDIEMICGGEVVGHRTNDNWPVGLTEDARGPVVSIGGELFRLDAFELKPYTYATNPAPSFYWILNLLTARDGAVWVASANGVFRLDQGNYRQWSIAQGIPNPRINCLAEDADRAIWAGTPSGLVRIKEGRVCFACCDHGLPDHNINSIVPDDYGSLWVQSSRGIFRLNRRQFDEFAEGRRSRLECDIYDGMESVKTTDVGQLESSGCRTADGRIWFPSPRGAIMIDPGLLCSNTVVPPVHLQQVRANGVEILNPNHPRLRPGYGELEFAYTALSFINPQKVQFRYQLEGYDPAWIDAGQRRSVVYGNLKPGRYTFRVQACNADGIWNRAGDSVQVELPPRYFQTAWFRVVCGLAGLAALAGLYLWRVRHLGNRQRQLQQINERLESRVRGRTADLAHANEALREEVQAHKQAEAQLKAVILQREQAETALADQRNMLRTLIDHLPDNVFVKDLDSRVVINNLAHARALGFESPLAAAGKSDLDCFPEPIARKFIEDEQKLLESGEPFNGEESSVNLLTGETKWFQTTKVPLRNQEGRVIGLAGINRDITERKEWEARLEDMHKQLVETSRQAGMAEVATGVLHNVGNVLNSVNVSVAVVAEKIRNSRCGGLGRIAALLREHQADLAEFLGPQGKGRQVTEYIEQLSVQLAAEQAALQDEINSLGRNVEHIKGIVAMQQAFARVSGVQEIVGIVELVEDALRMQESALQRHGIRIVRDFSEVPSATLDRHKALQILMNLLTNARHACEGNPADRREIVVRLPGPGREFQAEVGGDRVRVIVSDNGVGIAPGNLTRIFTHGFTTRKNGHGFGLHSGANAAKEMGGELTVFSEGEGKGATFTFEFPLEPRQKTVEPSDCPTMVGEETLTV